MCHQERVGIPRKKLRAWWKLHHKVKRVASTAFGWDWRRQNASPAPTSPNPPTTPPQKMRKCWHGFPPAGLNKAMEHLPFIDDFPSCKPLIVWWREATISNPFRLVNPYVIPFKSTIYINLLGHRTFTQSHCASGEKRWHGDHPTKSIFRRKKGAVKLRYLELVG